MVDLILPRLVEWTKSDTAQAIVLKGAGEKALCAGGDITALAQEIGPELHAEGIRKSVEYFGKEYVLDQYIANYKKPFVSLMDGITMGGGVGLSVHAPFRVATEKTLFAMPETNIGLFPDVGGSFFLSRLDGKTGVYLGLTSDRLKGYDVFLAGIASHYVPSNRIADLEGRLAELNASALSNAQQNIYDLINQTLEEFSEQVPSNHISALGGEKRQIIDECFSKESVEEVLQALEQNGSEFALKTKNTILDRCPTSVKVTFANINQGRDLDITSAFRGDYYLAENFMNHPDFAEGVDALLLTKPSRKANWKPATLAEVSDSTVSEFLIRRKNGAPDIEFLTEETYTEYPHSKYSLPSEEAVMDYVVGNTSGRDFKATRKEVVDYFIHQSQGKVSVEYKINEILDRMTQPDPSDPTLLDWKY